MESTLVQLTKTKLKLRIWEEKFRKKYKVMPDKNDIDRYPEVKALYKLKEHLKKECDQSKSRIFSPIASKRSISRNKENAYINDSNLIQLNSPKVHKKYTQQQSNNTDSDEVLEATPNVNRKAESTNQISKSPSRVFSKTLNKIQSVENVDEFDDVMQAIQNEDFRIMVPQLLFSKEISNHSNQNETLNHLKPIVQKKAVEETNFEVVKPFSFRPVSKLRTKIEIDFRSILGVDEMEVLDSLALESKVDEKEELDIGIEAIPEPKFVKYASKAYKKMLRMDEKDKLAKEQEERQKAYAFQLESNKAGNKMNCTQVKDDGLKRKRVAQKLNNNLDVIEDSMDSEVDESQEEVIAPKTIIRKMPSDSESDHTNVPDTEYQISIEKTDQITRIDKNTPAKKLVTKTTKIAKIKATKAKAVSGNFISMNLKSTKGRASGSSYKKGGGGRGGFGGKTRSQPSSYSYGNTYFEEEMDNILADEENIPTTYKQLLNKTTNVNTFIGCIDNDCDFNSNSRCLISKLHFAFEEQIDLIGALKNLFGFTHFRSGQIESVRRILDKKSTFTLLPTGSGKSLCYQLTSYILRLCADKYNTMNPENEIHGITLVITPTIALMLDQLSNTPPALRADALCGSNSASHQADIFTKLENSQLDILFISPERLQSPQFISFVKQGKMPKIWLACIDEAHCLSEWSHNFRPSYLHVSSILKELGVGCFLAMTGTATLAVQKSICGMLELESSDIVSCHAVRYNLKLKIEKFKEDKEKDSYLLELFQNEFKSLSSIIIYTMFQSQADKVASVLRINNIQAESYHAGKEIKERQTIQKRFMNGSIRILVATIAFGLGMDKKDIRSVIHYSLPSSLENYVQEIGRSGRDNNDAHCRLLLCANDYLMLRKFAYSEGMEMSTLRRFITRILSAAELSDGKRNSSLLFSVSKMEKEFDLKQTVLSTLLNYLEIETNGYLKVGQETYMNYRVNFLKQTFEKLLEAHEWLHVFRKFGVADKKSSQTIALEDVLSNTTMTSYEFIKKLNDLRTAKEIHFEGLDKGFCVHVPNFVENIQERLNDLTESIHEKIRLLEISKVAKLDREYTIFNTVVDSKLSNEQETLSIHKYIGDYFMKEEHLQKTEFTNTEIVEKFDNTKQQALIDVSLFVQENILMVDNGRTVAKILHGISSPKFPAYEWSKHRYWQKYPYVEFSALVKWANKAIIQYATCQ